MNNSALNRRQLLKGMSASLGLLALRGFDVQAAAPFYFTHGVASGDPLADRVILWTRSIPGSGQHSTVHCQSERASVRKMIASFSCTHRGVLVRPGAQVVASTVDCIAIHIQHRAQ